MFLQFTKKRYLIAYCGGLEDQPAKLEVFEDAANSVNGTSFINIDFTKVKRIVNNDDDGIIIEMHESDGISFYSDNEIEHKKWVRICGLLATIPNYSIPEEPKYKLVPREFVADPKRFDAGMLTNCLQLLHLVC